MSASRLHASRLAGVSAWFVEWVSGACRDTRGLAIGEWRGWGLSLLERSRMCSCIGEGAKLLSI